MTAVHTGPPPASLPGTVPETVDIPHDCEPTTADVSANGPRVPAGSGRRLIGVDVARGLALLGMMVVHILPPVTDGVMSTSWVLSVGKAAALFAVLAGVGIAFGSGGRRRPVGRRRDAAAASLVVRAVIIAAVGLLLGYVVPTPAGVIILPYYAVLFVLAIPLLSLSTRALVVLTAAVTVLMPLFSHVVRAQLPPVKVANPTFTDLLAEPLQLTTEMALTGAFPALPWLAYLCAGLAVGRSNLGSRAVVAKIGGIGVVVALGASAGSWLLMNTAGGWRHLEAAALTTMTPVEYTDAVVWGFTGTTPTATPWWLGVMSPHSSTPFDLAFTIGTSLAVLAAAIFLGRMASRLLAPLAAAGGMTFTLYALHLLMNSSPVQPASDAVAFVAQAVLLIGFAVLWGRWFSRGPLEAAVWWATHRVRDLVLAEPATRSAGVSG